MADDERLKIQREKGEYWEEVNKFIDDAEIRADDGDLTSRRQLERELHEFVNNGTNYTHDEYLCAIVLRQSAHPTAYFAEHGKIEAVAGGCSKFPWGPLAAAAIEKDVMAKLSAQADWFKELPQDPPDAEDEEDS